MIIKEVSARKIKDSRGKDTIEVLVNGCKASSPSGTSAGKYETAPFHKDVMWDVKSINEFKELIGIKILSFADLHIIEDLIVKKFRLTDVRHFGADALFALESAILKALAASERRQLWQVINPLAKRIPIPLGNAIGGGKHSDDKDAPSFQEFLLIPNGKTSAENVRIMKSVYNKLGKIINAKKKGQEGEWQTSLREEEVLDILSKFKQIRIGVDVASSEFYNNGEYHYKDKSLDRINQIVYINHLIEKYDLLYVEDPLDEEDFSGFSKIIKKNLISGDDLTVSHMKRVKKAYSFGAINCIILKPNQTGSLLEIAEIVRFCKRHGIKIVLSHRAGETMDSALADYAFAFQADYIKCGIATKWREIKLKRLIEIEKSLK
jgi:enolase